MANKHPEQEKIIEIEKPLPEKTEYEHQEDLHHFVGSIPDLIANRNEIYNCPRYFHLRLRNIHLGTPQTGMLYLPLGVLLQLWQHDHWKTTCPDCGAELNIYAVTGSLLSGRSNFNGYCLNCRSMQQGHLMTMSAIIEPAIELVRQYCNRRTIKIIKNRHFLWGEGVSGKEDEESILRDWIEPAELNELLAEITTITKAPAYWIQPRGAILPITGEDKHIDKIIEQPSAFNLTTRKIEEMYARENEELGVEGKARAQIINELIAQGFIRIRHYTRTDTFSINIYEENEQTMSLLSQWARAMTAHAGYTYSAVRLDLPHQQKETTVRELAAALPKEWYNTEPILREVSNAAELARC